MIPDIAALDPVDGTAGASDDDDLAAVGAGGKRRVGVRLQRYGAAATQTFIGGDHHVRIAILDSASQRIRRKAAKHHRMNRADACAGQHRDGGLGDHRHIDGDPVALLRALGLHHIGKAADFLMQRGIGDVT